MTTNKIKRNPIRRIHSMEELRLEKARLTIEMVRAEESIKSNYRQILSAFSLRNIFSTVTTELSSSTSVLSKAFVLGKKWIGKRKKKKKEKAGESGGM